MFQLKWKVGIGIKLIVTFLIKCLLELAFRDYVIIQWTTFVDVGQSCLAFNSL